MNAPHENAQTATEATGDAETSAGAEGGRDDLRAAIREALKTAFDYQFVAEWICCDPVNARHKSCSQAEKARKAVRSLLTDDPEFHPARSPILDAVVAVVQPELDRLTERIPYREGETDEEYQYRQIARWRSEAWQARGKLKAAETERDRLKAALGPVPLLDEPCGSMEPADGRLTCTLPARHDVHYAAGSGTVWRCLCTPTDAEAAIARVRALAEAAERTGCGAGWTLDPAEVLAALDRSDLPAVREFVADLDPRGEGS